jgi:formylglycine-generating enzyme required for sulfatase activity
MLNTPNTSIGRPFPWGEKIERNSANYYGSQGPFEKNLGAQGNTTPVDFYNGKTYNGYQTSFFVFAHIRVMGGQRE